MKTPLQYILFVLLVSFIFKCSPQSSQICSFCYFKNSSYSTDEKHEITKRKDSENATDATTVLAETLKEEPTAKESLEENELKIETATETSAGPEDLDNTNKKTISKHQIKPSKEQNRVNEDDDRKPEFETAPNCSIDEHQEDHTQVGFKLILF